MKKKLILIFLAVLVIAAIAVTVILLSKKDTPQPETPTEPLVTEIQDEQLPSVLSAMYCKTAQEIEEFVQQTKIPISRMQNFYVIDNLPCDSYGVNAFFLMQEDKVESVSGYFASKEKLTGEDTVSSIKLGVDAFVNLCAEFFGVEIFENNYHYFSEEGFALNKDDESTYKNLLDGKASFSMIVKEGDELWMFKGTVEEQTLIFDFTLSRDMEKYAGVTPDITVEWSGIGGNE